MSIPKIPLPLGAQELPEFPRYWITSQGDVYSERRQRLLKHVLVATNYYRVTLTDKSGSRRHCCLAQLVGQMFVPNPLQLPYAVPIDGVSAHFHAANLKWAKSFSPPNPPVSVAPGEQRRVTTIGQLLILWNRFEDQQQSTATLLAPKRMAAKSICCILQDSEEKPLLIHVRNHQLAKQLHAIAEPQDHIPDSGSVRWWCLSREQLERALALPPG